MIEQQTRSRTFDEVRIIIENQKYNKGLDRTAPCKEK